MFYHENRIAAEFFHVITDGGGGEIYLKSLVARYLELRHGISIPAEAGIRSAKDRPSAEELQDAFLKYTGKTAMTRHEDTVYHLFGTPDATGFMHLVTGVIPTDALIKKAREYQVTVTGFLSAVMTKTIIDMQAGHVRTRRQRPDRKSVV